MPGDLSQWIMKHYDPEMSQIVIPDRGKISVDAESVHRIWGLPNKGRKVCFEMNPDVIREFNSIYNIEGKNSPTLTSWCKMIENMNRAADDDFLRAWLAVAFSCFLAPTTSLSILPRCFPAILNTNVIKDSKICDFVVDQLRLAFMGFGEKKKAVCCYVFHLVILYLDSLEVDEPIPSMLPRAAIWNDDLITKVMKKDKKGPGVYGKLRLKTEFSRCAKDSLFGSMDHITKFVAARLPQSYNKTKQKRLTEMVHEMCTEMSHAVGKLVVGVGKLDDGEATTSIDARCTMWATSQRGSKKGKSIPKVIEHSSTKDEESYESDSESDEDEPAEDSETESDNDDSGRSEDDEDPQTGNTNTNTVEEDDDLEEDQGAGDKKHADDDQGKGDGETSSDGGNGSHPTEEVHSEEGSEKAGTEKDDQEQPNEDDDRDDRDKDNDQTSEKRGGNRKGNDEDDEDRGGGHNTGAGTPGGNSAEDEPAASSGSTNEGDCSIDFFIQEHGSKAKGADDPKSISLIDIVMMEFNKQWKPLEGEKLDLPKVYDGRTPASYSNMIFQSILEDENMQMACTFNMEELCPLHTQEELMQEICGFHAPIAKRKEEPKRHMPPLPPRKKKRVSFNLAPIEAGAFEPRHETRQLVSSLKHKQQTEKVNRVKLKDGASEVKVGATCMGAKAVRRTTEAPIADAPIFREKGTVRPLGTTCKQGLANEKLKKEPNDKTKGASELKDGASELKVGATCMGVNKQASFCAKLPKVDLNLPVACPKNTCPPFTDFREASSHATFVQNDPKPPGKLRHNDSKLAATLPNFTSQTNNAVRQASPLENLP
ncbi:uncharacterized protein LOC119354982 [Triticum dicoccoides]|uniref:uncharacterized protein LOC119354982 n=1 Tax=Triticum dicoccoides TaxID=85692 RepID=UPI000E78BD35|nr:uncharacterized protein LOC119354982 [Triticum dicoccoides]